MADPLTKNPSGSNIEVLYTGVITLAAATAPSVGSNTRINGEALTTINSGSGFILLGSIQFEGDSKIYPLPWLDTMSSGGDGGEISYDVTLWAGLEASVGAIKVYTTVFNYNSTLYLPASTVTFYILRVAASPAA